MNIFNRMVVILLDLVLLTQVVRDLLLRFIDAAGIGDVHHHIDRRFLFIQGLNHCADRHQQSFVRVRAIAFLHISAFKFSDHANDCTARAVHPNRFANRVIA